MKYLKQFNSYLKQLRKSFITMDNPVVTVTEGKLKGSVKSLLDGSQYYSFKGIPYARPPVGELRFKAPQQPLPWDGIRDAAKHGPVCPQMDIDNMMKIEGDEDCLFLNVYTQTLEKSAKVPVMVFIHGGGFMSGSGNTDLFGPEFLLPHDVVLITINYRLEVLGFLSLDIPEVPGNAGMKDQVAALKWIQNNIQNFGGDPNNVTIFGESAGAASVTYHMISPASRGLFHKAIAQSGVCLIDWAQSVDTKERAFTVAKALGKETNDINELLNFLKSVPATDLLGITLKVRSHDEKLRGLPIAFTPVVEKTFEGEEPFLTEEPLSNLLEKKFADVPLMIGYTSAEGLLMLNNSLKKGSAYDKTPSYLVPREIARAVSKDKLEEFGERIKEFYFAGKEYSNDSKIVTDLQTDLHFSYNIHRFTHYYSMLSKSVYFYQFNFDTDLNFLKNIIGLSEMKGACHADDLFYLFYNTLNKDVYDSNEEAKQYVNAVTKLWTDFAKTGNPAPDPNSEIGWPLYTQSKKEYISLDKIPTVGNYVDRERIEFWNKIYSDAGLPHIFKSSL